MSAGITPRPARAESSAAAAPSAVQRGRRLAFPSDHGAHTGARIEWWYLTAWLAADPAQPSSPTHGLQITFFRNRLGAGAANVATAALPTAGPAPGRFEPRHLLFAHAALTDLTADRHHHSQRMARWNGEPGVGPDRAALADADLSLARWRLRREGAVEASTWAGQWQAESFSVRASFRATQPLLLQGEGGFSRKGPDERQASHYYSLPQLSASVVLELQGRRFEAAGRAWLDHEWSDELLHPQAVGWDWIGINLFDGSALTAFRLRRADGSALWAGGSWRAPATSVTSAWAARNFADGEVHFEPGRRWRSAATHAAYPVTWQVRTPAGQHTVRALLDAQELGSRSGAGGVYWEGLSELLDESGRRVGLGYLEMTGYAAPLKLG